MDNPKALIVGMRAVVRRAWQTLRQVRDPDSQFLRGLSGSGALSHVVRSFNEAYGYDSAKDRWSPSPEDMSQMEAVMEWMAWLRRREGEGSLRRIIAWSMNVPMWQIARREKCSERTIVNRIDRSLAAILAEFYAVDAAMETVEEPCADAGSIRSSVMERPRLDLPEGAIAVSVSGVEPGKVWIEGVGFMFRGKRWNDGSHLAGRYGR